MSEPVLVTCNGYVWRLTPKAFEAYLRDTVAGRPTDLDKVGKCIGHAYNVNNFAPGDAASVLEDLKLPAEPKITDAEIRAIWNRKEIPPALMFECSVALSDKRLARSYLKPDRVRKARAAVLQWLDGNDPELNPTKAELFAADYIAADGGPDAQE